MSLSFAFASVTVLLMAKSWVSVFCRSASCFLASSEKRTLEIVPETLSSDNFCQGGLSKNMLTAIKTVLSRTVFVSGKIK